MTPEQQKAFALQIAEQIAEQCRYSYYLGLLRYHSLIDQIEQIPDPYKDE